MNESGVLIVHTDGGSRGNPGPAACAFVVEHDGKMVHSASRYLGKGTNNFAEYNGVLLALDWFKSNKTVGIRFERLITFLLDSELVVKQLNGLYKVKDENLRNLFFAVMEKIKLLGVKANFQHIPREKNTLADFLVNQELDSNS